MEVEIQTGENSRPLVNNEKLANLNWSIIGVPQHRKNITRKLLDIGHYANKLIRIEANATNDENNITDASLARGNSSDEGQESWHHPSARILENPRHRFLYGIIRECLTSNVTHSNVEGRILADGDKFCERNFDGFSCWDRTPAGSTAVQSCPSFVFGFDHSRMVVKKCEENGTWSTLDNRPWTNYSTCVDVEDLSFREIVTGIYVGGYGLSAAALILAIMVFLYFKSLACTRVKIHMHLFVSTLASNVLWVSWLLGVLTNVDTLRDNPLWCQLFNLVLHYSTVSTYMWMFVEGLHLYLSLTVVFVRENIAMFWFVAIGWAFPLVLVGTYGATRYSLQTGTDRCWMDTDDTFWIISAPVLVTLIASLASLLKIVRVLMTKLQPDGHRQGIPVQMRKAIRATCILIPLFGLHYMMIPFSPEKGSTAESIYQIISALLTSLQGFCVAVLFCFTNQDVQAAARAHVARVFPSFENIPMTGVTAGDSLAQTRDNLH